MQGSGLQEESPHFHYELLNSATPNEDKSRLTIHVQVKNDELQFVKEDETFIANFEISVIILDSDDYQVDGKIWKQTIRVKEYKDTNSRTSFAFTNKHFDLNPDKYKITVSVEDTETSKARKFEDEIELKDFTQDKLMLSDVLLADQITTDSTGINSMRPVVSDAQKGLRGDIYAYYELYNLPMNEKLKVSYKLKGQVTKAEYKGSYEKDINGPRAADIIKIPTDSLRADEYKMEIKVQSDNGDAETEKTFFIQWMGMPSTINDIEKAIEQVQYVANREEWKKLQNAPKEDKVEVFLEFWKRHDPTPGTEINEAMDAHYSRVEYANRHFAAMNREGWRSDMGMIYIMLGSPDEITRNAFPRFGNTPYEIWQYYRYNTYFEFYDPTGFGEYRLANPASLYEIQRLLTR
jgi:GWxTD domain-containing protein